MAATLRKTEEKEPLIHTDSRGRATLGARAGNKDFTMHFLENGDVVLRPVRIIPERELWLWQNPTAIGLVQAGLNDASAGRVHDIGSFAQFADQETDD